MRYTLFYCLAALQYTWVIKNKDINVRIAIRARQNEYDYYLKAIASLTTEWMRADKKRSDFWEKYGPYIQPLLNRMAELKKLSPRNKVIDHIYEMILELSYQQVYLQTKSLSINFPDIQSFTHQIK